MKRFLIDNFGRGLDTTRNPTLVRPGYARISRNLIHNRGEDRAELRAGIDRVYATRPSANPVYGLFEYINNAGTITRLIQVNGSLRSFTLSPGDTTTEIDSGHQTTGLARFTTFLNFWIEADARDNNYIGNGTAGYPFQINAPTSNPSLALASGSDMSVGAYRYDYARYSSITGEISPAYGTASSITTTTGNQRVAFTLTLATSEQFDQLRIYRTRVGGTQYYELTTQNTGSPMSYTDTTADASLTTVSTIHTSAGATNTNRPVGATDVVYHRGRIHLIGLTGNRSRHRWSQLNSYSFDSTTDARHDVDADDGDFLFRGFSYDGALILMKDHSIHIMNGDVDELSFTWQVVSDKETGIGCYCPFTGVATPIGVIFQGECGVYLYRPGMREPQRISDSIQDDLEDLDYSRRLLFVGGFDPCNRVYLLSVTPSGATTNTRTYAYFIDTGYWSDWRYGMGNIDVSNWALIHNSTSRMKAYLGESEGWVYESDADTGNDGVTSGTESGTATGGTSTTVTDTGAAFRTTGNGLTDITATVRAAGTNSYESQEISSNTGTILTTATFTTAPAASDAYYVGAIEGILSLGRFDFDDAGYKRFHAINFEFQSQSHSIQLLLGFTVDGDTQPSTITAFSQSSIFRISVPVNRIGVGISPYIRTVGVDHPFEILKVEIDYDLLGVRSNP